MTQRILGIDPAKQTGWATSMGRAGSVSFRDPSVGRNLIAFHDWLMGMIERFRIERVAYEEAGFGSNNHTTMRYHHGLRAMILVACYNAELPDPVGYHPSSIKLFATGNGRAEKQQMMAACERETGKLPIDDNVADAYFIMRMMQQNVPPTHKEATRRMRARAAKTNPLRQRSFLPRS